MTKEEIRIQLAGQAMAALVSSSPTVEYGDNGRRRPMAPYEIARDAVTITDCLIAELERTKEEAL